MSEPKDTRLDRINRYASMIEQQAGKAVRPFREDGMINMLNRYGTSKDSSEQYKFAPEPDVPDEILSLTYEGNGLFARIIDTPAEEAVKHGFTLSGVSDQAIEDFYSAALDELDWDETATGIKTYTCSACGQTRKETIDKLPSVANGTCGDHLTWVLDDAGTLTISGSGKMKSYSGNVPWYRYQEKIQTVVIEDGVTSIGERAFFWCSSLTSITIPGSVTSIGSGAFYICSSLKDVYYSGTTSGHNKITIFSGNDELTNATWHYNS